LGGFLASRKKGKDMKIVKDDTVTTSYGFFECPFCGAKFYGNGKALHHVGCKETGYDVCIYHVGPRCEEYEAAQQHVQPTAAGGKTDGENSESGGG
jgi:hypothetical protein